jgi:predicted dehydrogenase
MKIRTAVIGLGLIGTRRAITVHRHRETELSLLVDSDEHKAEQLASRFQCPYSTTWEDAVNQEDIELVVVSTPNNLLSPISIAAMKKRKNVLVEKPMALEPKKAKEMTHAAEKNNVICKVGFNLRFHPAILAALKEVESGAIGEINYIRAAYGHGGRPGYESEWRCNSETSGGGELLDQGIHLLDLCRLFMGDFSLVTGLAGTFSWPIAPLEDNAFALLMTSNKKIACVHASWTQWKNLFRFEIFGEDGYLISNGLGGNYGPEQLLIGRRAKGGGKPVERCVTYAEEDSSWQKELADFVRSVKGEPVIGADVQDGYEALRLVSAIYKDAAKNRVTTLSHSPNRKRHATNE